MTARPGPAVLFALGIPLAVAPAAAEAQNKPKRQRDLVTREEIMESAQREDDLLTALRSLRPRFLAPPTGIRTLGNSVQAPTIVVIDGKPMGNLETLQTIVASTVDEVRYLEPSKAGTEYGQQASGGAVVVKLWRAPKVTKPVADTAKPPSH
jgi:hypothetical protein